MQDIYLVKILNGISICECRWNITHFWMYSICTYLYTYMYMHDNKGCTTCFPPKMLNNTQPNIFHTFRLLIWCKSNIFFLDLKKKMFPKSSIFASQDLGSTLLLQRSGSQPLASKDEIQGQDFWKSYFIINMYNLNVSSSYLSHTTGV